MPDETPNESSTPIELPGAHRGGRFYMIPRDSGPTRVHEDDLTGPERALLGLDPLPEVTSDG